MTSRDMVYSRCLLTNRQAFSVTSLISDAGMASKAGDEIPNDLGKSSEAGSET